MEFIKIAYCITIPFLLFFARVNWPEWKKYSINLLAVSNVLLIGHSVFLVRQLMGAYQLAKSFSMEYRDMFNESDGLMIRVLLAIFLPLLSLSKHFRKNQLFSFGLWVLLYSLFPFSSWNMYDLLFKIPAYVCLLCAAYALFWLLNKLPYQSPAV